MSESLRRLAGVLIALNGSKRGTVYPLYEGVNQIGTGPDHEVQLPDPAELWPHRPDLRGEQPAASLKIRMTEDEAIYRLSAGVTHEGLELNGTPAVMEELIDDDTITVGGTIKLGFKQLPLEWWGPA